MKRSPTKRSKSSLNLALGAWAIGLTVGCTAVVGGVSGPAGTAGSTGTGTGNTGNAGTGSVTGGGGTGVGTGTGGGPGVGAGTGGGGVIAGTGGGGVATGTGGGGVATGTGGATVAGDPNAAGLRPLRLLTRREYANTVRDLGLTTTVVQPGSLPAEDQDLTSSFAFRTTGTVASQDAMLFRDVAEALAKGANINTLLPCAANITAANEAACLTTFLGPTGLAMKMFRRPLSTTATTGEVARLTALYTTSRAAPLSLNFAGAIGLLIEAMLQSAEFLYHWGDPAGAKVAEGAVLKLGPYEIASRLSYFLWGSMPDPALFTAAGANQLADAAGVDVQVRRMIKDAKAATTFADFFSDWLDIETLADKPKDPKLYPMFNDALTTAMEGEVTSFVNAILTTGTGRFDELMTGTSSFANQALASLYGITGVTGTALKAVTMNAAQRSGLLTMAGFMSVTGQANGSDPPRRGKAVFEKLFCGTLPPPPAVVPPVPDAVPGNGTTRQRFETHVAMPCATACHSILDPLGFAFENYDGIGAYRTTDNGQPVNASVTVSLDGQQMMFADARGLVAAMANSNQVQTCFTKQWLHYGLGRQDTAADVASINAALAAFKNSTRDVRELVVGLATSRTFRYRAPAAGEVLQ